MNYECLDCLGLDFHADTQVLTSDGLKTEVGNFFHHTRGIVSARPKVQTDFYCQA